MTSGRTRYALVGTGSRCRMFFDAICATYKDYSELVGICDISSTRVAYWRNYLKETFDLDISGYSSDEFDQMISKTRPNVVIVTSVDATHHGYIARAMELGCDCITEKPMTTDIEKAAVIFDAIARTGRNLRVTFNYRYGSAFTKLREVVRSGAIGEPTMVNFTWWLDTAHGADYFRRWHREKQHSGGLLVHKATHHFDLVNWLLADYPEEVYCMGKLAFYGEENAKQRGEGEKTVYEKYTGNVQLKNDPFRINLKKSSELKGLYLDAEGDRSGYVRDRNVFGGQKKWPIDIEDTMAITAKYRNGALLSYSLMAYCPWEGERVIISGTKGQVEYFSRGRGHVIRGQGAQELADEQYTGERYIRLQNMFKNPQDIKIPPQSGAHGGGDERLLERIFAPAHLLSEDEFERGASHIDGVASLLMGVAANRSIETGAPVKINDLFNLPPRTAGGTRPARL